MCKFHSYFGQSKSGKEGREAGDRSWSHTLHLSAFSFIVGLSQFPSSVFFPFYIVLVISFCITASSGNSDLSKIKVRNFNNLLDIVIWLFVKYFTSNVIKIKIHYIVFFGEKNLSSIFCLRK